MPSINNYPTAPYDLPSNATSFVDLFINVNNNSGSIFGLIILLVIFIIFYGLTAHRDADMAFATASWFTFLSSIFLGRWGMVAGGWVATLAAISLVSVLILWKKRDGARGY